MTIYRGVFRTQSTSTMELPIFAKKLHRRCSAGCLMLLSWKKKLLIRFDRMKYAFQKTFPCKFPLTTLNVTMLWAYFTLFAFSSASSFCLISPFYNIAVVKRIMRIKTITVHWQSRASLDPSHWNWKYETYFSPFRERIWTFNQLLFIWCVWHKSYTAKSYVSECGNVIFRDSGEENFQNFPLSITNLSKSRFGNLSLI